MKMNRKNLGKKLMVMLLLCGMLFSATLFVNAEKAEEPKKGGTLIIATRLEPSWYTINYISDGAIQYLNRNIYSKLIAYDYNTKELYGDLAEDWEVSEDLTEYTFKLRENVLWHDGVPFTAEDVTWTVNDILEQGDAANAYLKLGVIESCEALDDYTVVFKLKQPSGTFLNNLADYYGFDILPKHLFEGTVAQDNPYNTAPVGTGPFKFVEHVAGSHVILEANEDYYGDGPYLDQVIFQFTPSETTAITAIEAGDADWMTASPPFAEIDRLSKNEALNVEMDPSGIMQWIVFNLDGSRKEINDIRVREAILLAIDREEIAEKLYQGLVKPGESWYTTIIPWADNPDVRMPKRDVEKANQILDEAGYERGEDGYRFTLRYLAFYTSIFGTTDIPTFVKQSLDDVGIKIDIGTFEWAIRSEMLAQRDWDICANGGDRGPDPDNFSRLMRSDSRTNLGQYKNEELDKVFADAACEYDQDVRAEYYYEFQRIVSEDIPYINIIEYVLPRVSSKNFSGFFWQENSGLSSDHMVNTVYMVEE